MKTVNQEVKEADDAIFTVVNTIVSDPVGVAKEMHEAVVDTSFRAIFNGETKAISDFIWKGPIDPLHELPFDGTYRLPEGYLEDR